MWWLTFKNNRAPLLCYFKLCAWFDSHQWIHGVTVRKRPIWAKIDNLLRCVPLRFDGWPWKTTGHFCSAFSSFVHHFIAIGELMLELQSGNTLFGSKSTLVIAAWPWNLTDYLEKTTGHLCYATSNIAYHFVAIGEFTLKLQSGNAQFGSKSTIVFSRVTLKFNRWPWKTIGHLS